MRRKRHEPLPPEVLDEPFGPPQEEYLYRCPVCDEEMLVYDWMLRMQRRDYAVRGSRAIVHP